MTWGRMVKIVDRWLPPARILHSWPEQRFAVMTQGKSRMRYVTAALMLRNENKLPIILDFDITARHISET